MLGLNSVGYDPHPFFALISEAKVNSSTYWGSLAEIYTAISEGLSSPKTSAEMLSISGWAFLNKMFDKETLACLLGARFRLEKTGLNNNPLAFLILSRMLDYCCFSATDGIYKAPTSKKHAFTSDQALGKIMDTLREDTIEALSGSRDCQIICRSSESMNELRSDSVDLVVTSPPYLNNFDFAEMTRMYLYFWRMADSWSEITSEVRSKLVVNTTTALKGQKPIQQNYRNTLPYSVRLEADEAVLLLQAKRAEKTGKKEYDYLVYPYLSQMQSVVRECSRVLKPEGAFHMIVSDAALYGIHLPAPQWLAEIMKCNGFKDVECDMMRPRGHRWILDKREGSEKGLGEYYVFGRAV
ncbi:MAG: site-specific DNA-methyltransferase [Sphingomonadaceae bacterium]|nr:site-specific DNA-methyltransferase [Sphingomonadaceae bacterium]